jgi:hypothetical protein
MNVRPVALAISVLVGATAVALPASAQKPPKPKPTKPYTLPGPVSITAKPNPVVFSTPVIISGRVQSAPAGTLVTLMRRTLPSGTFTGTATSKTAKNGSYSFSHRPPRNTYYRVVASLTPPVQSGDLLVPVRTLVGFRVSDSTPAAGSRVRFSGIVRPRHDGRTAYIQRKSGTRWVTLARPRLRRVDGQSSGYAKTLRVRRSGTYRVRVLGHSDHAQGISRERTLIVH